MADGAKKKCLECDEDAVCRGYCPKHYQQARKAGKLEVKQHRRKNAGGGKRRGSNRKQEKKTKPKRASNEFEKELRELIRLHDQGAQVVFDVDGRKFTILEVDVTVKAK